MNEVHVDLDELGRVRLRRAGEGSGVYTLETTEALRAFFQAERDQELGWWRDPEEPDWVASPTLYNRNANAAIVYNERTRFTCFWQRRAAETSSENYSSVRVAQRYFAAHPQPEPEPKPWEDAKEGDCWVLTIGGETSLWRRRGSRELFWMDGEVPSGTTLKDATAGRRIWPEPRIGGAE